MTRKTMAIARFNWCILVICHIVLCSHSLRHHRGHPDSFGPETESETDTIGSDLIESVESQQQADNNSREGPQVQHLIQGSQNSQPQQVKIKPGHELKLKCELNNTYGRIMWLLNKQSIRTDNGRYSIQGPSINRAIEGRLTINNVLPEDNGIWQCHETKFDGKEHVSKPIWVIVLSAPRSLHLEFDGRRVIPSTPSTATSPVSSISPSLFSNKVTYREKDNASIVCVVEGGNPVPLIHWFLNGKNITNSTSLVAEYLEDDKTYLTRSTFRLDNVSRTDHNKSLVCVVNHELLPFNKKESSVLRASVQLNIEYSPSFILSRIPPFGYPLREGIFAALKCDIDANPWSSPVWMKDGIELPVTPINSEAGYLNFTQLNKNHTGWYKCISRHKLGLSSSVGYYLKVRYEPSIVQQPPSKVDATVGDRVSIKCEADGQPNPGLCWSRIGYGGTLTSVGSGQELVLNNILYQEAGSYRCVAQNRIGLEERRAQSHDISVVVTGRPVVFPTNRTITAFAGQPLSLSLEMCANPKPTRAFWIFGNTALRPGSRHRNKYVAQKLAASADSTDCYHAVLTILNLSTDDGGEYIFFVKNEKGVHEGTISLNITQASFSVSSSSSSSSIRVAPASSAPSRAYKITPNNLFNSCWILLTLLTIMISMVPPLSITIAQEKEQNSQINSQISTKKSPAGHWARHQTTEDSERTPFTKKFQLGQKQKIRSLEQIALFQLQDT